MPDDHLIEALRQDLIDNGFLKHGDPLPETFSKAAVFHMLDMMKHAVEITKMEFAEDYHKARTVSNVKH